MRSSSGTKSCAGVPNQPRPIDPGHWSPGRKLPALSFTLRTFQENTVPSSFASDPCLRPDSGPGVLAGSVDVLQVAALYFSYLLSVLVS